VAVVGVYVFMHDTKTAMSVGGTPKTTIDVTAVRNDLLAIANAERRYWISNSKYASLDELRVNGDIQIPTRPSYAYSAEAGSDSFRIIASYAGSDPKAPKRISVDETLNITTD
jgi:hypothetical protein